MNAMNTLGYLSVRHLSIVCVIPECENRVVAFSGCVLSTVHSPGTIWFVNAEHLLEALLEVVRQEAVEEWVGTGVDIGEYHQGEVHGGAVLGYDVDQVDNVGSEEGQPTNDKHQHDDHYHASHLTL